MRLLAFVNSSQLLRPRRGLLAASVALASVLLATSPADADPVYRIVLLGDLGGNATVLSNAEAINDHGVVVGVSHSPTGYQATVFDITGGGANLGLGTLGGDSSHAFDVSNKGQIVGHATATPGFVATIATLFDGTGSGANVNLGGLVAGEESTARAVNDSGVIVGWASLGTGLPELRHATRFDPSGGGANQDLAPLSLATRTSFADAVDAFGTAYGQQSLGSPAYWTASAFATGGSPNMVDLGNLGGNNFAEAFGVNAAGSVVGWAASPVNSHAALFDPSGNGANVDLGTVPGYQTSVAYAINDSNAIVGRVLTGSVAQRAAMFDASGGGAVDLNTLIDPTDPLFGVFELLVAHDINNHGQIVGVGVLQGDPRYRAFLLNPATPVPEAGTLWLLGAGLIGIAERRARSRSPSPEGRV